jgi:DNA-3-methyladenine glycosylase II
MGRAERVASPDGRLRQCHALPVPEPYRLDLTVTVLRRLSTNLVDVLTRDRAYVRILGDAAEPIVVRVTQPSPGTLTADIQGPARAQARVLALLRRILGVDVDLTRFYRAAASIPWLHPLALRMRGVRPPRYPTLWEACVNAIVFQQISLAAAGAILGRLTAGLGAPTACGGVQLHRFPDFTQVQRAEDALLRSFGLSAGKLATLRRVGEALAGGTLSEALLEERATPDAAALLQRIKGIGPWTAAVILLRGLGRLDAFPPHDASVARTLALVGGSPPFHLEAALGLLGAERGMLYYHLLLARLEARGELVPLP